MAIDLTGGIDPSREYVLADRPQDPEMRDSVSFWSSTIAVRSACRGLGSRRSGELGHPRHPAQCRLPRRPGVSAPVQRAVATHPRSRRAGYRARGRGLGISLHRALRYLDDDVRRARGADVVGRFGLGHDRRPLGGHQFPRRGEDGRTALGAGRAAGRRRHTPSHLERRRHDGWATLRAIIHRHRRIPCRGRAARVHR